MNKLHDLFAQLKKTVPTNKISLSLMAVCSIFLIWGGIRACSAVPIIARSHIYIIARDPSWYPLNLMGKEKTLLAFTSDLLLAIAKRRAVKIEIIDVSSGSLFQGLNEKKYGAIISSLAPNPLNNQHYNFSNPFFLIGPVLIVPKDIDITSFHDRGGLVIGVRRTDNVAFDTTKYNAYYKPYDTMTMAFDDLQRNRIDGIILPILQASNYIDAFHKGDFKMISFPTDDQGLRIVARRTYLSDFLIEEFNKGVQELIDDGTYRSLCAKWGLVNLMNIEHGL